MFQVDVMSRTPIYEQLIEQLERFILTGTVSPDDQIPSVRSLSTSLSINPVTILKAYNELSARGLIHSVPGRGYFVCRNAKEILSENKRVLLEKLYAMASELALAGISKSELYEQIEKAYTDPAQNGKEKNND